MFLLFFTTSVFAYTDYGIVDLKVPTSIVSGQELEVNITLANNSSSEATIPLSIMIYSPSANLVFDVDYSVTISSDSSSIETYFLDINQNSSTQPYLLRASIEEQAGNQSNNMSSVYFTIRKGASKIPVPDLPYFLPIILVVFVAFFIFSRKEQKRKHKRVVRK